MSLDSAIGIASSGLATINRQLAVVSNNVANAGTAGYVVEAAASTALSANGVGYGVRTGITTRTVDAALQAALTAQRGDVAGDTTRHAALAAVAVAQGNTGAGDDLASRVGALTDAFTALAADPSNQTNQAAVVAKAATLAGGIQAQATGYADARQAAQDAIGTGVATLNTALRAIGTLSDQIIAGKSIGQSTAELEDQRDVQENAVAGLAGMTFLTQGNGDVLAVAGGLLADTRAATGPFAIAAGWLGAGSVAPRLTLSGTDVTTQLTGGSIGANLQLRDTTLPTLQAGLDELAHTLATRLDSQGLRLFTDADGTVPVATGTTGQAGYIGFSQTITVNPAVTATPSLVRDGTQAVADGTGGASAFTPNPAGGPAGFTGLTDRVLQYAFGSTSRAGVAQTAPATTGLGASGTLALGYTAGSTLASFAANLVGAQSTAVAAAADTLDTATALQSTLQAKVQAVSGVSVDTELSTMIALQNAYGANAKIITAAQTMWSQLLSSVNP